MGGAGGLCWPPSSFSLVICLRLRLSIIYWPIKFDFLSFINSLEIFLNEMRPERIVFLVEFV